MKELIKRSNQAAATFLDRRGYEIIEQLWEADADAPVSIVARDDEALVFASVTARRNSDSFPTERLDREELEKFAINWLKGKLDHSDCAIRFDHIAMLVISPDRAIIRHHVNALSTSDIPEEE